MISKRTKLLQIFRANAWQWIFSLADGNRIVTTPHHTKAIQPIGKNLEYFQSNTSEPIRAISPAQFDRERGAQAHAKKPFERSGTKYCDDGKGGRVCTGAMMGRRNAVPEDFKTVRKLHLVRVRLDAGGYDKGGAYWGKGDTLWCAWGESDTEQAHCFMRAIGRRHAKLKTRDVFPNAVFYR